jgi:hypothetical protein
VKRQFGGEIEKGRLVMNTKQKLGGVRYLVLGLFVFLAASAASAQSEAYRGKFTLPMSVRWGTAVLQAGDYTFSLNSSALHSVLIVRADSDQSAVIVLPSSYSDHVTSENSSLLIVRSGGKATIRRLHLKEASVDFFYRPTKGEAPMIAQQPELIQRVPVLLASK